MDPLMLILDELVRIKGDCEKIETELSDCEARIDFTPQNSRYVRLSAEKDLMLKNLCDVRMELCKRAIDMHGNAIYAVQSETGGEPTYHVGKVKAPPVEPAKSAEYYPPSPAPRTFASSASVHSASSASTSVPAYDYGDAYLTGQSAGVPAPRKIAPTDLPDLPEYLQAKATLATIMRDFTDNKIHFVGLDNHVIAMAEYQGISKFIKAGEDPARFMKGNSRAYKTGYNKKTNSFTENRLFLPTYHPYALNSSNSVITTATAATQALY